MWAVEAEDPDDDDEEEEDEEEEEERVEDGEETLCPPDPEEDPLDEPLETSFGVNG